MRSRKLLLTQRYLYSGLKFMKSFISKNLKRIFRQKKKNLASTKEMAELERMIIECQTSSATEINPLFHQPSYLFNSYQENVEDNLRAKKIIPLNNSDSKTSQDILFSVNIDEKALEVDVDDLLQTRESEEVEIFDFKNFATNRDRGLKNKEAHLNYERDDALLDQDGLPHEKLGYLGSDDKNSQLVDSRRVEGSTTTEEQKRAGEDQNWPAILFHTHKTHVDPSPITVPAVDPFKKKDACMVFRSKSSPQKPKDMVDQFERREERVPGLINHRKDGEYFSVYDAVPEPQKISKGSISSTESGNKSRAPRRKARKSTDGLVRDKAALKTPQNSMLEEKEEFKDFALLETSCTYQLPSEKGECVIQNSLYKEMNMGFKFDEEDLEYLHTEEGAARCLEDLSKINRKEVIEKKESHIEEEALYIEEEALSIEEEALFIEEEASSTEDDAPSREEKAPSTEKEAPSAEQTVDVNAQFLAELYARAEADIKIFRLENINHPNKKSPDLSDNLPRKDLEDNLKIKRIAFAVKFGNRTTLYVRKAVELRFKDIKTKYPQWRGAFSKVFHDHYKINLRSLNLDAMDDESFNALIIQLEELKKVANGFELFFRIYSTLQRKELIVKNIDHKRNKSNHKDYYMISTFLFILCERGFKNNAKPSRKELQLCFKAAAYELALARVKYTYDNLEKHDRPRSESDNANSSKGTKKIKHS